MAGRVHDQRRYSGAERSAYGDPYGPRGADMSVSRADAGLSGSDDNWNDYGGTGVRYGGSSSGGYGSGGAALDYHDLVGSRHDWEHRYSDPLQVFPERGDHRGRGPRNYTRRDERIGEDVNDRLTEDPHIDASNVDVTVEGGEVTLSGTVMSRPAKHHAEDITESISGVRHVQNNLRIQNKAGVLMGAGRSTGRPQGRRMGDGGNTPTIV